MAFPTTPTIGQIYTIGNRSWTWNGQQWETTRYEIVSPPTIDLITVYDLYIDFKITNNDEETVSIIYGLSNPLGDEIINLGTLEETATIRLTGLTSETAYSLFAYATKSEAGASTLTEAAFTTSESEYMGE